jgi:flagellar biosynthesis protein FlhG
MTANSRGPHQTISAKQKRSGALTIAIGGGKGGIGKSFISSNLAICLARMGHKVALVDLDLGSANLHTCLGLATPTMGLSDFVSGRAQSLSDLLQKTEVPGLSLIGGLNDALNIANLHESHKNRIIEEFPKLPVTHIVLDLGAGTSENTLDFFLAAQCQVLAVTPEPTSIENAYRFLKSSYYRKFQTAESTLGLQGLIEEAMDQKNRLGIKTPSDLVRHIAASDPAAGFRLAEVIKTFNVQVLLNQVRTRTDIELGFSVKSVCRKYFGIHAEFLGYLEYDNAVWQSLRRRRPVILEHPSSNLVGQFLRITKSLIQPYSVRDVV